MMKSDTDRLRIAGFVAAGLLAFLMSGCQSAEEPFYCGVTDVFPATVHSELEGVAGKLPQAAEVEVLVRATESWDGRRLPVYPRGRPEITIMRITIAPGAQLPVHMHPVINAGVLLEGELVVTKENGESLHLRAGDPIIEVVDTWHEGRNPGGEPAIILVFYAGVEGGEVTVRRGD